MACTEPRLTALKIAHKGEIHRLRVDLMSFQYADLMTLVAETFALAPNAFVVQYADAEGDVLNVTSQAEYVEACRVFLASADAVKALRFTAVSRSQVAFQENVAEPILKAIEKLVETLKNTMDKVKHEHWAQRAQHGVEHTGEAIKCGMEHTGEVLHRAAKEARESLEQTSEVLNRASIAARGSLAAAGKTIQEIPFDKVLKETGENLKAAAEVFGAFANEIVEELRKIPVAAPAPAAAAAPVPTPSADPEWEQVEQVAPAFVPVEETQVEETPVVVVAEPEIVEVVTTPAVSPEEIKWGAHIAMVRDIFPEAEAHQIIERLEQCNGNVEVVLNAMME